MISDKQKLIAVLVLIVAAVTAYTLYKKSCGCKKPGAEKEVKAPVVATKETVTAPLAIKPDSAKDASPVKA
jgi:hypothetical protein